MESQTFITYEVTVPETNRMFITKSYEEAVANYEEGCMVFEKHITVTQPSLKTQSRLVVTLRWTRHPDHEED